MKKEITAVKAGATITDSNGATHVVLPPCALKNHGYWFCSTHREVFENQFQKDSHIHTGKHELVWLCRDHGFEQP